MKIFVVALLAVLLTSCSSHYEINQETQAVEMPMPPAPKPAPLITEMANNLQKQYASTAVKTIAVGNEIKILYPSDNLFAVGKVDLTSGADAYLSPLWNTIQLQTNVRLMVEGLTDNSGNAQTNVELSAARAENVAQYFIQQGFSPSMIIARGYGGAFPVVENDSSEHRAMNRLIIVTIKLDKTSKQED